MDEGKASVGAKRQQHPINAKTTVVKFMVVVSNLISSKLKIEYIKSRIGNSTASLRFR